MVSGHLRHRHPHHLNNLYSARQLDIQVCRRMSRFALALGCMILNIATFTELVIKLQQFVCAMLDDRQESHHVDFGNGSSCATRQIIERTTNTSKDTLNARSDVQESLVGVLVLVIVENSLLIDITPFFFKCLQNLNLVGIFLSSATAAKSCVLLFVI